MKTVRHLINLALIAFTLQSGLQPVMAQKHKATNTLDGTWTWTSNAKGKVFAPKGFDKKDPHNMLALNLSQKGNKLTGKYINTVRFVAKIEDGDFSTVIEGNRAQVELESGFGGKIRVLLTHRGNKLYWQILQSEGEHYFPKEVMLNKDR